MTTTNYIVLYGFEMQNGANATLLVHTESNAVLLRRDFHSQNDKEEEEEDSYKPQQPLDDETTYLVCVLTVE